MCHYRRIALLSVTFLLALSALPAAAQPGRAAAAGTPGLRWAEIWQSLLAPFAILTDDGRAIWDPNGGDAADAPPSSVNNSVDDMTGGGGVPL